MNEKVIWDYLMSKLNNPYGVAGLMGNLYVESRLDPTLLEGSYARKLHMSSAEYTKAVDNGTYANFATDSAGYGLAQWTYHTRKQALLETAKKSKSSIGNLNMQLGYLWDEIQKYTIVINTLKIAKSVKEASDVVVLRYEKPKDISEKGLANRASYGQNYFNMFQKGTCKEVLITEDKVNLRTGNGKQYGKIAQVRKNSIFEWVATSENGWNALVYNNQVVWVSGEFSKVQ